MVSLAAVNLPHHITFAGQEIVLSEAQWLKVGEIVWFHARYFDDGLKFSREVFLDLQTYLQAEGLLPEAPGAP